MQRIYVPSWGGKKKQQTYKKETMEMIVGPFFCHLEGCVDVWQSNLSADCKCTVNATIVILSYKSLFSQMYK